MASIHLCFAFCPAYLIGKCIGQGKEKESALAILCTRPLKRREEKERLREVRSRNFVTSFTEYNKDKVPMDVATSLVVNHINIGILCLFLLCLCLCLWQSCRSKIIHKKDRIKVGILCMNAKLL